VQQVVHKGAMPRPKPQVAPSDDGEFGLEDPEDDDIEEDGSQEQQLLGASLREPSNKPICNSPAGLAGLLLSPGPAGLLLGVIVAGGFTIGGKPWDVSVGLASPMARGLRLFHIVPQNWAFWKVNRVPLEQWRVEPDLVQDLSLCAASLVVTVFRESFECFRCKLGESAWREVGLRSVGALLLGYGACIGAGCTVSGYLGGISSFSLHGWLWPLAAMGGNLAGLWARQWAVIDTCKVSSA